MTIDTGTTDPVSQKPYPIAMKHYQWVKEEIEKLLAAKVIWTSHSSWSAPIIVGNGGKCLVIDYRALNKVTRKFTWPMPKVEDIFSKLNRATYFTTLDLQPGYHHIPLDKPSIPKTAFNSPFRKFEYVKVPFRLAQSPAYFQELMTGILKDFPFTIAYLDDIIIFSKTPQEYLSHIHMVLEKLKSANLSVKKSKCSFFSKEILQYLGHTLSATGIQPLPAKTHAIQNMKLPTTPKQVRAFLGLVGYYWKFIKGFTKIAKPLTLLTRQQVKFWLDTSTSCCFSPFERRHSSSSHPTLSKSYQEIHCVHWHFRWCLQSTALTRTQWNWVPSSISVTYLYGNTMKMEHHRTGSLCYILHYHQVELLLTRSWHHCPKWP